MESNVQWCISSPITICDLYHAARTHLPSPWPHESQPWLLAIPIPHPRHRHRHLHLHPHPLHPNPPRHRHGHGDTDSMSNDRHHHHRHLSAPCSALSPSQSLKWNLNLCCELAATAAKWPMRDKVEMPQRPQCNGWRVEGLMSDEDLKRPEVPKPKPNHLSHNDKYNEFEYKAMLATNWLIYVLSITGIRRHNACRNNTVFMVIR